jgi:hypothetical protein
LIGAEDPWTRWQIPVTGKLMLAIRKGPYSSPMALSTDCLDILTHGTGFPVMRDSSRKERAMHKVDFL